MDNMSAEILRNIVAFCFNTEAKKVILSGTMPARYSVQACSVSGDLYRDWEELSVWGYDPQKGFLQIPSILIEENAKQNGDRSWENAYGYTAQYLREQMPEAIFFVQHFKLDKWIDHQSGREVEKCEKWTVYSPPRKIRK
jgi:hypothetical protein